MKHTKQFIRPISRINLLIGIFLIITIITQAQDTATYNLRLNIPLIDIPQNSGFRRQYPSMSQSLELSSDLYDIGFFGIDAGGNKLFKPNKNASGRKHRFLNTAFKYSVGLGFSKFASELPIPLGVWAHEEFHRSVLAVNGIKSKNGNWVFNRWDGSVYGVSDSMLSNLKTTNANQLVYAYAAGAQSEIASNQKITLEEFYKKRSLNKTALLLYNAWYVMHYFKGAISPSSDSAKVNLPQYENKDAVMRDFAGDDLTAWVYDMFNPDSSYTKRLGFPGGNGVNRRIGFSDLSRGAQSFLKKQKNMSLINFLNPAIFFIRKISVAPQLSFNLFAQYVPTHFGSDIAAYLPVQYKKLDLLLAVHNYKGYNGRGHGYDVGLMNYKVKEKLEASLLLHYWQQPSSFYAYKLQTGFATEAKAKFLFSNNWSAYISLQQKTKGWLLGNPYINNNLSLQTGLSYCLHNNKN